LETWAEDREKMLVGCLFTHLFAGNAPAQMHVISATDQKMVLPTASSHNTRELSKSRNISKHCDVSVTVQVVTINMVTCINDYRRVRIGNWIYYSLTGSNYN
jgi:hypothetical protein